MLSVGLATICFARLEWSAVYVCERLHPGYLGKVGRKTAGVIADDLAKFTKRIGDSVKRDAVSAPVAEFKRLARRRNDLVHANPGTSQSLDQRLYRHGDEWTIAKIEELFDEFAVCEIAMNAIYHQLLGT